MSNNNVELYSSEEVSQESKLQQLQKPKFKKPDFVKPEIEKAVDSKSGKVFDITQEMEQKDIDNIPRIPIAAKYLKKFYDGLMGSIHKYNEATSDEIINGIVKPLSSAIDSIGLSTNKIDSELKNLRNEFNDFRNDMGEEVFWKHPNFPVLPGKRTGYFNAKVAAPLFSIIPRVMLGYFIMVS